MLAQSARRPHQRRHRPNRDRAAWQNCCQPYLESAGREGATSRLACYDPPTAPPAQRSVHMRYLWTKTAAQFLALAIYGNPACAQQSAEAATSATDSRAVPASGASAPGASSSSGTTEPAQAGRPLVQTVLRQHQFSPIGGPPGCRVERRESLCRSDSRPAQRFAVQIRQRIGYGTTLRSATLRDGCVVLDYALGVDHQGPDGRLCLQPQAVLDILVTFDPTTP